MLKIKNMKVEGFKAVTVPITYYKSAPLDRAMDRLFVEVDRAHRAGANILILSDRGVDENHVAIPSLLAVSAVHQHLVKNEKRELLLRLFWSPASRARCTISQHCPATVPAQSTRTWHSTRSMS